ncbi:MAG TPA: malto-oligosyltrehalose trehalohydrolase [Thermoanaerobaculia bacterium]|nr:malto-oligosyltrehalose trehalohydrolase [Thermoanaerobaculia bacterium]
MGALWAPGEGTRFRVWAPRAARVEVRLVAPEARVVELAAEEGEGPEREGYFSRTVAGAGPGTLYLYRLHRADGEVVERPDPASRFQPRGVHGPSAVVARPEAARPGGGWRGRALDELVLYELHVGTFSEAGTFDGAIGHLDDLVDLGVTAVEVMPVAQFPGSRNWGYDGVLPFAVQDGYGGPEGLGRLVDAAHARGLAVVLDVVYNHLGPEGNVLGDFGPYFTDRYRTPWGDAINYDGGDSEPVRRLFVESAVRWVRELGVDGLRCDAVHAIVDESERPFLAELAAAVHAEGEALGRPVHLFAESADNTLRFLRPPEEGGAGFDAQWSDDFHHSLHALLTGERDGYYRDFGRLEQLARCYRDGWAYSGDWSPYRRRRHGVPARGIAAGRFVVCAQNHDQTGNRAHGDRLAALVDLERLKLAAGALLLSPGLPLLFMGEEWGEERPFLYFVSHGDAELVEAVRRGRAEEFAAFGQRDDVPDPQAEETFARSRLDRAAAARPEKAALRRLYRELLRLRREVPALARRTSEGLVAEADEETGVLRVSRGDGGAAERAFVALNFSGERRTTKLSAGRWRRRLDSAAARWAGPRAEEEAAEDATSDEGAAVELAPWSFQLFLGQGR